jgi:ribosomal protein S18 acetylase RimI-like enzyme
MIQVSSRMSACCLERRLENVIRPAVEADAGAIAYAAYLAGQGHCRLSTYDLMVPGRPGPTAERIYLLKRLVEATTVSWLHYSHCFIAEVDGLACASLGAFSGRDSGNVQFMAALRETGWNDDEISLMSRAIRVYTRVEPTVPRDGWMIENAAALPGFRRRGLVRALLAAALDRGRELGHSSAMLACHIGNEAAFSLYQSAGFEITAEATDPEFEVVFGCPGMWQMTVRLV